MLEAHTFKIYEFPRIATLRTVADTEALEIGIFRELLGDLWENICESILGLYRQSELALFANEPEYHGGTLSVLAGGAKSLGIEQVK